MVTPNPNSPIPLELTMYTEPGGLPAKPKLYNRYQAMKRTIFDDSNLLLLISQESFFV
jgi:hypothetical protein